MKLANYGVLLRWVPTLPSTLSHENAVTIRARDIVYLAILFPEAYGPGVAGLFHGVPLPAPTRFPI